MIDVSISIFIICMSGLFAQYFHYMFLNEQKKVRELTDYEKFMKDFDDYKKRVDSIAFKVGFK